jgi:hypothetical protein
MYDNKVRLLGFLGRDAAPHQTRTVEHRNSTLFQA